MPRIIETYWSHARKAHINVLSDGTEEIVPEIYVTKMKGDAPKPTLIAGSIEPVIKSVVEPTHVTFGFHDYERLAERTANYEGRGEKMGMLYVGLGLCGEAGEVGEKIKKIVRNKKGEFNTDDREELAKEVGDVLWYLSQVCHEFNLDLSHCASVNIQKLEDRKNRGVLHAEGDNR